MLTHTSLLLRFCRFHTSYHGRQEQSQEGNRWPPWTPSSQGWHFLGHSLYSVTLCYSYYCCSCFFENVREGLNSHQKYLRRNLPRLSQRSMRFSLHFISPYLDVFHLRFAELVILMWSEILL